MSEATLYRALVDAVVEAREGGARDGHDPVVRHQEVLLRCGQHVYRRVLEVHRCV